MAKISTLTLPSGNDYDIRASAIPYAQVDSTSTETAFTATVPGVTELTDGACVILKNGVVTSASGFTININELGAKPVYSNLATGNDIAPTAPTRETTIFNINYTMIFVYSSDIVSGGGWVCYRGYDANTNTIGYQIRTNSSSLPMSSITYRYRLLFTSADGKHFVPANNSSSTNATSKRTTIQEKIDPFGKIVYYGTTASVAAGSRPSASSLWEQFVFSLGYSFNRTGAALALTAWKPVYLKCEPQSDGSAIIEEETPYVQDLPTTEDGMIYIMLGVAYSATNIELFINHPVYEYKKGAIRQWTNARVSTNGYHIECKEDTSVGTAKTDTAKTGTSNYTPSGEIDYETKTIRSVNNISSALGYTYYDDNYVLYIYGVNTDAASISSETVVTAINGFNGNGVTFEIKENGE